MSEPNPENLKPLEGTSEKTSEKKEEHGVISVVATSKAELYAAYMPFIKNGALFISTTEKFSIGEEVFILLQLMEETEKFPLACKVIWITPLGAQGGMRAGIGVQFTDEDDSKTVRNKIETYLAGMLNSDRRTDTM